MNTEFVLFWPKQRSPRVSGAAEAENDLCSNGVAPEYRVLRPELDMMVALSGVYFVRCVLAHMIEEHGALLLETWSLMFTEVADQPLIVVLRVKAS